MGARGTGSSARELRTIHSTVRCATLSRKGPTSVSREPPVAFEHLLLEARLLAPGPQRRAVPHAIAQRAPVGTVAALQGPGDADELRLEGAAGDAHRRVAMAAHVHGGQMRGERGGCRGPRLPR